MIKKAGLAGIIFLVLILLEMTGATTVYSQKNIQSFPQSAAPMPRGLLIKGSVISVDPPNHTIEIQSFLGKTQRFVVDENVQIFKCQETEPITLPELRSGTLVTIKS